MAGGAAAISGQLAAPPHTRADNPESAGHCISGQPTKCESNGGRRGSPRLGRVCLGRGPMRWQQAARHSPAPALAAPFLAVTARAPCGGATGAGSFWGYSRGAPRGLRPCPPRTRRST